MGVADLVAATVVHHATLEIRSDRPLQILDLTSLVESVVRRAGLWDGLVAVTTRHTTTGLLVNEQEPLLEADLAAMFERLVPDRRVLCARRPRPARRRARPGSDEMDMPIARPRCCARRRRCRYEAAALALGRWQRRAVRGVRRRSTPAGVGRLPWAEPRRRGRPSGHGRIVRMSHPG